MVVPKTKAQSVQNAKRLYRFSYCLWSGVACIACFAPWAYTLSAVLFAAFLNFAALDGE